jgi:hypothetical protein
MIGILKPVDNFDSFCERHDQDYRICLDELKDRIGFPVPTFVHQIMAIRGLIPHFIRDSVFGYAPQYLQCMHDADAAFVNALDNSLENDVVPVWWKNKQLAPDGAEGVNEYHEACSLGIPWLRYCIVSPKMFFQMVAEMFRISIHSDLHIHIFKSKQLSM